MYCILFTNVPNLVAHFMKLKRSKVMQCHHIRLILRMSVLHLEKVYPRIDISHTRSSSKGKVIMSLNSTFGKTITSSEGGDLEEFFQLEADRYWQR